MDGNLFRVKVREYVNGHPQASYRLVVAEDEEEALDKAKARGDHELYDEEIQRAICPGEISESRVERKYESYIERVEYIE